MDIQKTLKPFIPHIGAITFFVVILFIFFKPAFTKNEELLQNDIIQFKGMSKEVTDFREKTGEEALWTNSMFSGMPAYQISVTYPSNLFQQIQTWLIRLFPAPAGLLFVGMVCCYILLLSLGVDYILCVAGAFAFAFSTNSLIYLEAGHNTKVMAISFMPLVVAGVYMAFNKNKWIGALITGIAVAFQLSCNHLQITYYLMLFVVFMGSYELYKAFTQKTLKHFFFTLGLLFAAAGLGAGTNAGNLMTTSSYTPYTIRGKSELTISEDIKSGGLDKDYAFRWSNDLPEILTLMIPNFRGGASGAIQNNKSFFKKIKGQFKSIIGQMDSYWGALPFTSGPVYLGAVLCFLFILGAISLDHPLRWVLVFASTLAILLSLGKNFPAFNNFFFDYFPGYNKFRAVAMTLVIAQLSFPIMAVLVIKKYLKLDKASPSDLRKIFIAFGCTGGLSLLFYLMPSVFVDFFKFNEQDELSALLTQNKFPKEQIGVFLEALENARMQLFKADALRTFFFIALTAGSLIFFLKKKISPKVTVILLSCLIMIDIWTVDNRYLNEDNFQKKVSDNIFRPTPADAMILKDPDPNYRVFNLNNPFNDGRTSFFHKSIGGYHGAKLRRYQDMIEKHIGKQNISVINMLNTKYFITQDEQRPVSMNPGALGNAWFVSELVSVKNPDQEIEALSDFEPDQKAFFDKSIFTEMKPASFKKDSLDKVTLLKYKPNNLKYNAVNKNDGLIVFSEIYYEDGWNAYLDGKLVEHFRVNFILRAMMIPAGTHQIEFKFEPKVYFTGERISLASSLILFIASGILIYFFLKKPEKLELAKFSAGN